MNHGDHVGLLREGVPGPGIWADLGSGTGAFTLALADLLGPSGRIVSVDRDRAALRAQEREMDARFPDVPVEYRVADFTAPLDLPPLDGMAIANALHFHRDPAPILARLRGHLRPGGRLLVVEYDVDRGNPWVPHPFSYPTWLKLAERAGFDGTRRLATRPSSFLGRIYSALSFAPA
jgi:SAM-dependent methyltransferase